MPMSRRRKLVITLVSIAAVLVVAVLIGVLIIGSLFGGAPSVPANSVVVLRVGGTLPDNAASDPLASKFLGAPNESLSNLLMQIKKAKVDKRVGGLLLRVSGLGTGWGKAEEIRQAIADFRTSGKPVYASLEAEFVPNGDYFVASACDKVFISPESQLFITGLAADVEFYRGSLDKLGVTPEYYKIGKYKNAPEVYTDKELSEGFRETLDAILGDLSERFAQGIADGRRKSIEDVRTLIDNAPLGASEAKDAGLVDGAIYRADIDAELRTRLGYKDSEKTLRVIAGEKYEQITPESLELNMGERIAVIYAPGVIMTGNSGGGPFQDESTGSDTIARALRRAADDESIKAVVLRVDSPGGSPVASDIIHNAVARVQEKKKPVVVSMGDYAASGGYYISANADRIVAEPSTITGSIGIYGGKFALKGFYDWIGVTHGFIPKGRNAGFFRESETWTESQRTEFQQLLARSYQSFVQKVATGRKRDPEYINSIAQGRAWTGTQAKERGLVDELGGLERAVEIAKELARIPKEESIRRVVLPAPRTLLEELLGGGEDDNGGYAAAKARREQQAMLDTLPEGMRRTLRRVAMIERAQEGGTLLMMPYELRIK